MVKYVRYCVCERLTMRYCACVSLSHESCNTASQFFPVPLSLLHAVARYLDLKLTVLTWGRAARSARSWDVGLPTIWRGIHHYMCRQHVRVRSALRLEATLIWGAFHLGFGETLLTLKIYSNIGYVRGARYQRYCVILSLSFIRCKTRIEWR